MRSLVLLACLAVASLSHAATADTSAAWTWREATAEEQALDAAAFAGFDTGIGERLGDVQSVVVVVQGRIAYQYHRDGNAEALRDTQSVRKSALAVLVGAALQQGHLASLDMPVVALVPEWAPLNPDPRAGGPAAQHGRAGGAAREGPHLPGRAEAADASVRYGA